MNRYDLDFELPYPVREPTVPTLDDLLLADQLRRELELRLLAPTERPTQRYGAVHYNWADAYSEA